MVPTCDKQTSCRTTPKDSSSEPASSWELSNHTDVQNIGSELQLLQVLKLENGWESLKKRRTQSQLGTRFALSNGVSRSPGTLLACFWPEKCYLKWFNTCFTYEMMVTDGSSGSGEFGFQEGLGLGTMGRPSEIVVNQEYVHAGRRRILRIWTSVAQGNGTGCENVISSSGPICWIVLDSIGFYWILLDSCLHQKV